MKKLLFFLLVLGVSFNSYAQTKTNTWQNDKGEFIETTKPIFLFDEESYDFGDMIHGEKYTHIFKFQNIGAEDLILTNVKASCGCTTPVWPKEPIASGETAEIKVIFNTKGKRGNINKAVTITSNAVEPVKRIFIKGKLPMQHPPKDSVKPVPAEKAKPIMEEENSGN